MDDDMKTMLDEINKLTLKTIRESKHYQEFLKHLIPNPNHDKETDGSND